MATSNEIRIIVSQYYTISGCLCTTFLLGPRVNVTFKVSYLTKVMFFAHLL